MYVRMYVCMYVRMYVCVCIRACTREHVNVIQWKLITDRTSMVYDLKLPILR